MSQALVSGLFSVAVAILSGWVAFGTRRSRQRKTIKEELELAQLLEPHGSEGPDLARDARDRVREYLDYKPLRKRAAVFEPISEVVIGVVVATAVGSAALLAYTALTSMDGSSVKVATFTGRCSAFTVYSQNRWEPLGTAVRAKPDVDASTIGSFAGNAKIVVDGWVQGQPAYPTNLAPWDSDVWFHAKSGGFVSFAGVRAAPTVPDPTGQSRDGGPPAPTSRACEGSIPN